MYTESIFHRQVSSGKHLSFKYICYCKPKKHHMQIIQSIQTRIYEVRGERIMLDFDLAGLYEVETKIFNQAVKRI